MLLSGCANTKYVTAYVPADLRTPCAGPKMSGLKTEGQMSTAIVKQAGALQCANGKITAISEILNSAEEAGWQSVSIN